MWVNDYVNGELSMIIKDNHVILLMHLHRGSHKKTSVILLQKQPGNALGENIISSRCSMATQ